MLFHVVEGTCNPLTVTAEVASSSLVVPAIPLEYLQTVFLSGAGTITNDKQNQFPSPATAACIRFGKIMRKALVGVRLLAGVTALV